MLKSLESHRTKLEQLQLLEQFIGLTFLGSRTSADGKLEVFALRVSELGLISSMRLDGRKDIQSVKSAWSVLHAELKARVLPLYRGIAKDVKRTHEIET